MALSAAERDEFLAQPHVAALAVAAGPGRGPLMVPIWYHYSLGGPIWISTRPDSRKAKAIAGSGRFSLLVQRVSPTTRYVSVEGKATIVGPTTDDDLRKIASRYLLPEKVEPYVAFAQGECRIELKPEHWLSADLGTP
ncbi:pyridoxamine 5'-phosphate oxidase family protein [Rathayibacter sp. CAU 1779]